MMGCATLINGRERKAKKMGSKITFIDLRLERGKFVAFEKGEEDIAFHKLHVPRMNNDLWDGFHGLASETWKGCE